MYQHVPAQGSFKLSGLNNFPGQLFEVYDAVD